MEIICFDEAGNTGQNLLDRVQPSYVLASVKYSDLEVEHIHKMIKCQGSELHFNRLRKTTSGKKKILKYLNSNFVNDSNVFFLAQNKRFGIVCSIVDNLVAPKFIEDETDIFAAGLEYIIANKIYSISKKEKTLDLFNELFEIYVNSMRSQNVFKKKQFYELVDKITKINFQDLNEYEQLIFMHLKSSITIFEDVVENSNTMELDPYLGSFLQIADFWGKKLETHYSVLHDESKQFDQSIEEIESFSTLEYRTSPFGLVNIKTPLLISDFRSIDSKESKRVQIADIIASAANFVYKFNTINRSNKELRFYRELLNSNLFKITKYIVAPVKDCRKKSFEIRNGVVRNNFIKLCNLFYPT